MALNCLQIIQTVCRRIGITSPNAAVGSTDPQIIQLVAISEEEGQEQADRYAWQSLQTEATFTTVAAQVQGAMSTIAPNCDYIVNNTIWNRSLRRPVYGPKSEQDWQQSVAMQINGPFNAYRIINDEINFYPNPTAGEICAFEYITRNWVNTSTMTTSSIWTTDTDTPKISDQLMILGIIWRWKAVKGMDYAEDFTKYERRIADAMGRDGSKPVLDLTGHSMYEIQPVVMVPRGNW